MSREADSGSDTWTTVQGLLLSLDDSEMDMDIPEIPELFDPREPEVRDKPEKTPEDETPVETTELTPTVETNAPGPSTES